MLSRAPTISGAPEQVPLASGLNSGRPLPSGAVLRMVSCPGLAELHRDGAGPGPLAGGGQEQAADALGDGMRGDVGRPDVAVDSVVEGGIDVDRLGGVVEILDQAMGVVFVADGFVPDAAPLVESHGGPDHPAAGFIIGVEAVAECGHFGVGRRRI